MTPEDFDPTDTSATDARQQEQADAEDAANRRHIEDLKWLLSDVRGRRFYWRLLGLTHVFKTSHTPSHADTAFLEGERNIGLRMWTELQAHAPDAYLKMIKEQRRAR